MTEWLHRCVLSYLRDIILSLYVQSLWLWYRTFTFFIVFSHCVFRLVQGPSSWLPLSRTTRGQRQTVSMRSRVTLKSPYWRNISFVSAAQALLEILCWGSCFTLWLVSSLFFCFWLLSHSEHFCYFQIVTTKSSVTSRTNVSERNCSKMSLWSFLQICKVLFS